jgi:hypothetical protein
MAHLTLENMQVLNVVELPFPAIVEFSASPLPKDGMRKELHVLS